MAEAARLTAMGTANGMTINADVKFIDPAVTKFVTLSYSYARAAPPGHMAPPDFTGANHGTLDYPRTIASGTRLGLHAHEAAALVTAGVAAYS